MKFSLYLLPFGFICVSSFSFFEKSKDDDQSWENPLDSFFSSSWTKGENQPSTDLQDDSKPSIRSENDVQIFDDSCSGNDKNNEVCGSFLQRFVNIILLNTGLKNYRMRKEEDEKTVTVDVSVSKQTLDTLQRFSSGEKVPYKELDKSFQSFFEIFGGSKTTNTGSESYSSDGYFTHLMGVLFPVEVVRIILLGLILVTVIILAMVGIRHFAKTFPLSSFFKVMCLIFYVANVCQSLWSQYEDIYAKRILLMEESLNSYGSVKIPDACYPSRMSTWDRIYYKIFIHDDPCRRYLESKKSIFSEVDFGAAFVQPVWGLWTSLLPEFGDKAGQSLSAFSGHIPFPLNYLLLPLIIFCFFSNLPSFLMALFSHSNPMNFSFLGSRFQSLTRETPNGPGTGQAAIGSGIPPVLPTMNFYINGPSSSTTAPSNVPQTSNCTPAKHKLSPLKKKISKLKLNDKLELTLLRHLRKQKHLKN